MKRLCHAVERLKAAAVSVCNLAFGPAERTHVPDRIIHGSAQASSAAAPGASGPTPVPSMSSMHRLASLMRSSMASSSMARLNFRES